MTRSVLIMTLPPLGGGVPEKAAILARHLRDKGHRVTIAHYATLTDYPALVAPSWRLVAGAVPSVAEGICFGDFPCLSVGCRFPELEFPYYLPSRRWRNVVAAHDRHVAVGGTVLMSYPATAMGIRHLVWCASTMIDDRLARQRAMPLPKRLLDVGLVAPVQRRMERRVLGGPATFMAVSRYARESLVAAGGEAERFFHVPIPVDLDRFRPPDDPPPPGIIGFAGRTADPRKNVRLLIDAVAQLVGRGRDVRLRLTGDAPPSLADRVARLGLAGRVEWTGWLDDRQLPAFFRGLDIFAIPSQQEGLAVAGIQAMACGLPVVSSCDSGPRDYVIDGETGFETAAAAPAMAEALEKILVSRDLRRRLGDNARRKVETCFSHATFASAFAAAWERTWGDAP